VVTRGDTGCGIMAGFEGMAGVLGDAPGIDESHRIQHCAAVFVENYIFAYTFTDYLQAYSLRFHRGGVWAIAAAFNGGIIHEVELDITNSPLMRQRAIGLSKIILGAGVSGIEHVQGVELAFAFRIVDYESSADRLVFKVAHQPIFVMLIDPRTLGDFKRSGPNARPEAQ